MFQISDSYEANKDDFNAFDWELVASAEHIYVVPKRVPNIQLDDIEITNLHDNIRYF